MGSYERRGKNKAKITVSAGRTKDGKQRRFYKTVPYVNQKQIKLEIAAFELEIKQRKRTETDDALISDIYIQFMEQSKPILKATTYGRYETLYDNQIAPFFASKRILDIKRSDIKAWVKTLTGLKSERTGRTLAPKTIKNALSLFSAVMNYAKYDLELIDRNPCERVPIPKIEKRQDLYTEEDVRKLLQALDESDDIVQPAVIYLILFTGLRNGEVYGLKWEDIDLDKNVLHVKRERTTAVHAGTVTTTPKTRTSVRTVAIPEIVKEKILKIKEVQEVQKTVNGDYIDSGFFLKNEKGSPAHVRNTYNWWIKFIKEKNLKPCTLHDLRHTHVAMLSRLGVDILDVSHRLGHSSTHVTQDVYEYLYASIDSSIAEILDKEARQISQEKMKTFAKRAPKYK